MTSDRETEAAPTEPSRPHPATHAEHAAKHAEISPEEKRKVAEEAARGEDA